MRGEIFAFLIFPVLFVGKGSGSFPKPVSERKRNGFAGGMRPYFCVVFQEISAGNPVSFIVLFFYQGLMKWMKQKEELSIF